MNGKVNLNTWLLVCVLLLLSAGRAADEATIHVPADFNSIQAAIDAAVSYADEIEVAPGTYNESIDFNGKAVRLYSNVGPDVTIIDANGLNSSVFKCDSGEDANTVLEGFTITGGSNQYGGGMYNYYSNPTVTNCIFTNNSAISGGGGMRNDNSSPTVTSCTFTGNSAPSGGGMANNSSNPTITNCTFSGNTS